MAAIDSSIVNVSMPVIRNNFKVGLNDIEWVSTAYMISFCLFIPLTNWFKNKIGYYNLFLASILIFTVGSLLCSLSSNLPTLIIARVIQASGGGAISPTSLAILSEYFPKEKRGSAIGWWGIGNVMGPALGPTLGGVLTHYFGWPSIFYVNVPIGLITIFFTVKFLKFLRLQPKSNPAFDITSYIFFAFFIIAIQYTISAISKTGFLSWQFTAGFIITVSAIFFFIQSSRKNSPLLDLTVFRSASFVKSSIIIVIRSVALFGGMFFLPFLLQGLLGFTEIQSGLLMLPNALMMLVSRPYAGKMADRGLIRNVSVTGILLISLSFFLFSRIDVGYSVWLIILPMAVRGLGMSLLVAPVSTALLNSVTPSQTATATSMNSLLQQLGGSIGIAVSGVIHNYIYQHYLLKKYGDSLSEHYALQDSFLITAFVIMLALIPALYLNKIYVFPGKSNSAAE